MHRLFCKPNHLIDTYVNNIHIFKMYINRHFITVHRYVVCITVETFITICYPTKIKQMCTVLRARVVTIVLLLTALVIYSVAPFINKVTIAVICLFKNYVF